MTLLKRMDPISSNHRYSPACPVQSRNGIHSHCSLVPNTWARYTSSCGKLSYYLEHRLNYQSPKSVSLTMNSLHHDMQDISEIPLIPLIRISQSIPCPADINIPCGLLSRKVLLGCGTGHQAFGTSMNDDV